MCDVTSLTCILVGTGSQTNARCLHFSQWWVPQLLDGTHGVLLPQVVGGSRDEGTQDPLEGPVSDRQPAPPCIHRSVRIQGLREPLAPE